MQVAVYFSTTSGPAVIVGLASTKTKAKAMLKAFVERKHTGSLTMSNWKTFIEFCVNGKCVGQVFPMKVNKAEEVLV
jgi:hypothetical protein